MALSAEAVHCYQVFRGRGKVRKGALLSAESAWLCECIEEELRSALDRADAETLDTIKFLKKHPAQDPLGELEGIIRTRRRER